MAASQRDISVSEFFAKNRHLLGFDNPRKALLTTIKEAVDNSLDACEEAGILPEIWVHIEQTGANRFKVGVQDNGPGIVKKQIPLIFGKLLYGSKFHRLRMSRGQQGIGISAAGMYGVLTTGKPVKIISKVSQRKPAHYYEIQIDTKKNKPEILNGKGEGVDIPPGEAGSKYIEKHGIEWIELDHGTRVTIELEGQLSARPRQRRRLSGTDGHRQSARHAALHRSRRATSTTTARSTEQLPPEPKEIKPHPYGIELGMLVDDAQGHQGADAVAVSDRSRSRASARPWPRKICETAKLEHAGQPAQDRPARGRQAVSGDQQTKIAPPATDCISPIGEELLLKGLHQVVPGEFYVASTRPPAVYRGNPFQIEVGAGLRRHVDGQNACRSRRADRTAGRERRPHAAAVSDQHVQRPRAATRPTRSSTKPAWARAPRPASSSRPRSPSCTRRCGA